MRFLWYTIAMDNTAIGSETVTISKAEYESMQHQISWLMEQIGLLKRRMFGTSSQKLDTTGLEQISLFNEAAPADQRLQEPETEETTYKRKKQKGKREQDLSGLPVERVEHELPPEERICPKCGDVMKDIGVHVRRSLKLIPAKIVVVEDAIHAYACEPCGKAGDHTPIVTAGAPTPLISGSLATPSLVSYLMTQKYQNGLPLYRLEKGFQFDGVNISRQTMANWIITCAVGYLLAIYLLMISCLLKESVLHSDDTTYQVLLEPGRRPQTKSYAWLYRTSGCAEHPIVIYEYQETRGHEHPKKFLQSFKGYLHTDGHEAYHKLPAEITVVGCWFHARQYWEKPLKAITSDKRTGTIAAQGLAYIEKLFAFERTWINLAPEERLKERLAKSKPVSDTFFGWVESLVVLPKSLLGEAVHYALSQRKYLENVYLDGRLELSNNRAERSIKPFVIGRKNWLFAASKDGAKASSIVYSIVETAKENGLRPFQYIQYLLESLPSATSENLEALLPWSDKLPLDCYVLS